MDSTNSNISHSSVVNTLDTHVERLIADHLRLSQLVKELRDRCDSLKAESRGQQQRIQHLQHELAQSNLAAAMVGAGTEEDSRRAKAYINRLMREVDTCITLLSTTGGDGE
ncbi:MAG: hypothetical protein SNH63_01030 [Rikenellaceae bacterium]